jgi:VanZ family protein
VRRYSNLVRWLEVLAWATTILFASSDFFSSGHSGGWLELAIGRFVSPDMFAAIHYLLRKVAHLTVYGLLGALGFRAARGDTRGWRAGWAVTALAIVLIVASIDEWHQSTIPTRTGTPIDVVVDLIGASIVLLIYRVSNRARGS